MTRISIRAKDLDDALNATLEPGHALLIGRAPDPSLIDWNALLPQPAPCALMSPRADAASYRIDTLSVQSSRTSANHLLVLRDGAVTAIYDLGSRNGSWIKLGPQRPVVMAGSVEVSISLAGTPARSERLVRPQSAEWTQEAEFGDAVVRALNTWLTQLEAPVQVTRRAAGPDPASDKRALLLADDSVIELRECGTLQISSSTLFEVVCEYVHDQNARFMQLQRRVSGMVAGSASIRRILTRTAEAAASGRRLILLGPTGVGKELLARSYHGYSPRHGGPFVTVNCALLEKDLLYAQLFGARRGSFTGAIADVAGLIEAGDGGTLFLDELGEMSLDVQKALLRFLDSRGEYYRLGDPRPRRADVQIVCASNALLDDPEYRKERFRDDLWYRLAASVILVPPLKDRPDDISAFLSSRLLPGTRLRIAECLTEEALQLVLHDPFPGNFRDLENFIERLPAVSAPRSIDRATCEQALSEGRCQTAPPQSMAVARPSTPPIAAQAAKPPTDSAKRPAPSLRADPASYNNSALGWERIAQTAVSAFLQDHGEESSGWDQLQLLIEWYLKPIFVAHAAALRQTPIAGRPVNYSALARKLHIADGSTVKTHLVRFEERLAALLPLPIPEAGANRSS